MSSEAIGRVLGRLVEHELDNGAADGGPKILVCNFSASEVLEAIHHLEGHRLSVGAPPVDIVVASDVPTDGIPERFRLVPDRSLTWYRNNSVSGLVLVVLAETTDRQGLGQMFRITDRSILERRVDGSHVGANLLVEQSWQQNGEGGLEEPPQILFAELSRILDGVSRSDPMPLRPWARYVAAACAELRAFGRCCRGR